ncbi:MAG TPA: DUF2341 domain-containing protein [Anaerolineae bacterium]|nr:DUF2341 domain-containing protein [Anaerolineae bacterium]
MKAGKVLSVVLVLIILSLLTLAPITAQESGLQANQPQSQIGSAFTYQGYLVDADTPVDDVCNFQFAVWDDPTDGIRVAGPLEETAVPVAGGRFTLLLDFGAIFDGTALWLDVAVQCGGDNGYTTLSPRQPLTAAPYAAYSQVSPWAGIAGLPAGFADGIDDVEDADADPANELNLSMTLSGTQLLVSDAGGTLATDLGTLVGEDADADPTNELNLSLALSGTQLLVADPGGTLTVDLGSLGDDADADPTNELNLSLALSGTQLLVADPGGTLTADLGSLGDDADADPTNELNLSLALSGTQLLVSDAGGTLAADLGSLDTLQNMSCADGQLARWNGTLGQWECSADEDSTYTAGFGLVLSDTTFSVVTSTVQVRVAEACGAGYAIRQINHDGTVVCEPDDDTIYTAGTGLILDGGEFSVTPPYRLPQTCTNGQIAEWDGAAWSCGDDDAGTGFWSLTGNAGTDPTTSFLGTTDAQPLSIRTNGAEAMRVSSDGAVGIGTTTPHASAQLEVASTTAGFLLPRMSRDDIASIFNPADGLQVYNTTDGKLYIFVALDHQWKEVAYGAGTIYPSGPWQYVRELTIDNTANGDTLTDYQVLVQFDTQTLIAAGKMNADGSDLRFTTDFVGWLDYWIENGIQGEFGMDEPDTKVWVEVPVIAGSATTTIYMLYGNPAAAAMSDIQATFVFGDDFDDNSLDTSRWEAIAWEQGNIQEQNGRIEHLSPKSLPQSGSLIQSTRTFTEPVVIEMRFKKGGYVYRGAGLTDGSMNNMAIMNISDCCAVFFEVKVDGVLYSRTVEPLFWSRQFNPEYYLQVIHRPDGSFIINGSVPAFEPGGPKNWSETFTEALPLDTPLKVWAREDVWYAAWWLWDRYEDDIRVRKYAEPEPVVGISGELLYNDFMEGRR